MTLNYHNHLHHVGLFWFNKTAYCVSDNAVCRFTSGILWSL